jgi:phosphoribosylglycinamide formyltransferase-1
VETAVLDHRTFPSREAFDGQLMALIDGFSPDLVVLAGFMRILSDSFVRHYRGRMLNIHPSLLPLYPGLNTHERALKAGDSMHGATVHFVTEELDGGPAVLQATVAIQPNDDSRKLAARVLEKEHRIYPRAVQWFCQGRLALTPEGATFDGKRLKRPIQWSDAGSLKDESATGRHS